MQTDARTTGLVAELRALLAKATPGPWQYRPEEYDDWGFIRGGERGEFGFPMVAVGRGSHDDHDEHRRNGTDPYGPNSELIVAAVNALPTLLNALETQGAHEGVIEASPFDLSGEFFPREHALHCFTCGGAIGTRTCNCTHHILSREFLASALEWARRDALRNALSSGKTVSAGEGER